MRKTAFIIMMITIISKLFGFARDLVLSYFYGASSITDAYLISITIPTAIFGFIASGIATGYIPIYSTVEKLEGDSEGNNFTNNLINILFILCCVILILSLIFTKTLVKIFASGFSQETLDLTVKFTRIGLLAMNFTGLISIFKGFLQIKNNYITPAFIGIPMNITTTACIVISSNGNPMLLALGFVIGTVIQLLFLLPFSYKKGYRYKFIFDIKDKYIIKIVKIAIPVIVGVSVNQINVLIDKTIASKITEGGITALNYASQLNGFVQGLFVLPIITALYPMISKMATNMDMDNLKKSLSEAITGISILVLPAIMGSMMFSKPIVTLLFGRGKFDEQAIAMTSVALFFYSFGMIGFAIRDVLATAFYSLQDTKTPVINAAIAVLVNIILNIVLSKFMGIGGLALATSISTVICTVLLYRSLQKKIDEFNIKIILSPLVKITIASIIMGISSKLLFNILTWNMNQNLSLIISILFGALFYFVIILFMNIEEIDTLIKIAKKKLKKV